jgi:hypothetical protein
MLILQYIEAPTQSASIRTNVNEMMTRFAQVLLWVYGEQLRAMFANVVLAEYRCRYDWQDQHIKDIRDGMFYATQFASPQGALIPLNAQESLVLYRPKPLARQTRLPVPTPQLWLFELVSTA